MLLLVEDDLSLSRNVTEYLMMKGEAVKPVLNAHDCFQVINNHLSDFDLILLDIMLPDGDGLDILAKIRVISKIPIILTTALSGEQKVISALNNGADDYLVKPFHPELLLARINAIRRRLIQGKNIREDIYFGEKKIYINESSRLIQNNGEIIELSTNEFEIFLFLAKNRGKTVTRNQLYQASKGKSRHSTDRTIDIQVSKIRTKLNLEEEIKTIWGKGYLLVDDNL